jgi:hypothetical protein
VTAPSPFGDSDAAEWSPAPTGPLPTSGMATAAIIFAALSYFCLGPVGAIGGIACALIGYREIKEAEGRLGGRELCTVALALSGANLALTLITVAAFALGISAAVKSAKTPSKPPVYSSPYVAPPAVPRPGGPPHGVTPAPHTGPAEAGQSTPLEVVTEVKIGTVTLVDLPPTQRPLSVELRAQEAKASAAGERVVLFVVTLDCRPCMSAAAVLADPKMQAALGKTRLVRVNSHDAPDEIRALGAATETIPGFYLLSPSGRVIDGITGAEWDDDTADNIAPVLRSFLAGTYTKRRRPREAPSLEDPLPRVAPGIDL